MKAIATTLPTNWTQYDVMKPDDLNAICGAVNALQRENEALRAELANKTDKDTDLQWFDLELAEPFQGTPTPKYMKDNSGWVQLSGAVFCETAPTASQLVGVLPAGFRPSYLTGIHFIQVRGAGNEVWAAYGWIQQNGTITFTTFDPPTANFRPHAGISVSAVFKAAP